MKRTIIIITLFICSNLLVKAQDSLKTNGFYNHDKLELGLSYYGNNLWNPGLKFNAEYQWKEFVKTKQKTKRGKEKTKIKTHELLIKGDIGFYWDPGSHVGVFSTYGLGYRKTGTKGFQYNFGINPLGVYRSFLPETYEVNDNGDVKKVVLPGRFYYSPSFNLGIGKKFNPDGFFGKTFSAWYLNLSTMVLYKYNANSLPLVFVEYGFRFNQKNK